MGGKQGKGSRGHGFLRGALVLTAGMAVVKVLGALFKVPLTYVVGEYGIGMFNMAYHFMGRCSAWLPRDSPLPWRAWFPRKPPWAIGTTPVR